jgi:hypothetical protein
LRVRAPDPPASHQASDKANLRARQATERTEAARKWTGAPLTGKLRFLPINFHEGDMPSLDDNNMVNPIRDALNNLVYEDDRQIRYSQTPHVPHEMAPKWRQLILPSVRGRMEK